MGQAAYDYNAVRRRKAPQTQRKADLRVAKGGKRRLSPLQAAVHNAMHLVAAALLVGFAISLLWSESKLVELNDQIQDAKAQLVSEQSQYTYYNSTLNSKPNLTEGQNLTGESTPEGIVAALLAQGVQRVFLSMGADGILAGTRAELVHLPCLPTCMVNTTGGGDAVMAALVWAYLQGLDLRESAAAALRAGKATVEYPGTNNPDLGALVHG